MKKLLRHGRNSKPSSGGGGWGGDLIAVGDYLTFIDTMGGGCTLYEPNALSTTFYDWVEGDGVDVYLFGTFSTVDAQSLEVYVDGVLNSTPFYDCTQNWEMEMPAITEDFDNVLDAYIEGVPTDGEYHTIDVKTPDGTTIHTYSVRLFSIPGTDESTGIVYKTYMVYNRAYLGTYNSSTDTFDYNIDQALVAPPSNELWEGIVLEPTDGFGILGEDITIEYDDTILAPWSSNVYSIIDRQGITQYNGQTLMFLCADVIPSGSFSTYVTIKRQGSQIGKFEIFR